MPFEDSDIRWLLELLDEHGLEEIEVEEGDLRVRVRAHGVGVTVMQAQHAAVAAVATQPLGPAPTPAAAVPSGIPVVAPMAGIFYRQPSPEDDPFFEEGDRVEAGAVVGLIEVMKLFNEITAPVSGVISRFVADNGDRVEAEQPLIYIQPASLKE